MSDSSSSSLFVDHGGETWLEKQQRETGKPTARKLDNDFEPAEEEEESLNKEEDEDDNDGLKYNCEEDESLSKEKDEDDDDGLKYNCAEEPFQVLEPEKAVFPLTCPICRDIIFNPVATQCNHYFCKDCAKKQDEETGMCFLCNQHTNGVFINANDIKNNVIDIRQKVKAMVKDVKTMVEKALEVVNDAEAMKEDSAEMVKDVETMGQVVEDYGSKLVEYPTSWDSIIGLLEDMENVAANARERAEKAAEMVREANATAEKARVKFAKAVMVIKNVKWKV